MANEEHLTVIRQGVDAWNKWKEEHRDTCPDLSGANLSGAYLKYADLSGADLSRVILSGADLAKADLAGADLTGTFLDRAYLEEANLSGATLMYANLRDANLRAAKLSGANLSGALLLYADLSRAALIGAAPLEAALPSANLREANLSGAFLRGADLAKADLAGADLSSADLTSASLLETNLENANLIGCRIYGISAWNLRLNQETKQSDLIITKEGEPTVKVDDIQVAQFIYLLLNNQKIREVINTVTSKAVLILGRFSPERKAVLDAIHIRLREDYGLVPILFDWEPSASRDLTETIVTLAGMCRFIIADLTDAKSIPQELSHIIPTFQSVPIRPILLGSKKEYSMYEHWENFNNVLPIFPYSDTNHLLENLQTEVIEPLENWESATDKERVKRQEAAEREQRLRQEIAELKAQLRHQ
jgi:uncharacterized protein YjbI with pentapeptide repeats